MYINETDEESGQTPLHIACQFGNLKIVIGQFSFKMHVFSYSFYRCDNELPEEMAAAA